MVVVIVESKKMSGVATEEDKKPTEQGGAHINLKVKGQVCGFYVIPSSVFLISCALVGFLILYQSTRFPLFFLNLVSFLLFVLIVAFDQGLFFGLD